LSLSVFHRGLPRCHEAVPVFLPKLSDPLLSGSPLGSGSVIYVNEPCAPAAWPLPDQLPSGSVAGDQQPIDQRRIACIFCPDSPGHPDYITFLLKNQVFSDKKSILFSARPPFSSPGLKKAHFLSLLH